MSSRIEVEECFDFLRQLNELRVKYIIEHAPNPPANAHYAEYTE